MSKNITIEDKTGLNKKEEFKPFEIYGVLQNDGLIRADSCDGSVAVPGNTFKLLQKDYFYGNITAAQDLIIMTNSSGRVSVLLGKWNDGVRPSSKKPIKLHYLLESASVLYEVDLWNPLECLQNILKITRLCGPRGDRYLDKLDVILVEVDGEREDSIEKYSIKKFLYLGEWNDGVIK